MEANDQLDEALTDANERQLHGSGSSSDVNGALGTASLERDWYWMLNCWFGYKIDKWMKTELVLIIRRAVWSFPIIKVRGNETKFMDSNFRLLEDFWHGVIAMIIIRPAWSAPLRSISTYALGAVNFEKAPLETVRRSIPRYEFSEKRAVWNFVLECKCEIVGQLLPPSQFIEGMKPGSPKDQFRVGAYCQTTVTEGLADLNPPVLDYLHSPEVIPKFPDPVIFFCSRPDY
jgi:hypothetical protein